MSTDPMKELEVATRNAVAYLRKNPEPFFNKDTYKMSRQEIEAYALYLDDKYCRAEQKYFRLMNFNGNLQSALRHGISADAVAADLRNFEL